jgi:hypothetical protein
MKKVENSHVESSTMMNVISNPTKEDIDRREPDDSILYVSPEASLKPSGFEEESASERSVPSPNVGQVSAIEILFEQFAICAEKLNENMDYQPYIASVCLPQYTYKESSIADYTAQKQMHSCKGHVSTRNWALFFQGYPDRAEISLVPSENLLRYMSDEHPISNLAPFVVATSATLDEAIVWQIGAERVPRNALPQLARKLFSYLIRIACGDEKAPTTTIGQTPPGKREETSFMLGSLMKEQELLTWEKCRELERMINIDLALIDETDFLAHQDRMHSDLTENTDYKATDLCNDLRSLAKHIEIVLRTYSQTRR